MRKKVRVFENKVGVFEKKYRKIIKKVRKKGKKYGNLKNYHNKTGSSLISLEKKKQYADLTYL